jgi:branched-subunit amino acid aminotransferase/4-amino-4-deoxychorismate lyase
LTVSGSIGRELAGGSAYHEERRHAPRNPGKVVMQPLAYLNGNWIGADQAVIRLDDAGFVLGVTVTEQLRTFAGRLFRLEEHLARLRQSLEIIGVDPPMPLDELGKAAIELARYNYGLLAQGDDLGLAMLVTPGVYAAFSSREEPSPTVCLHTYPLPFRLWAAAYQTGLSLVTTPFEQVSPRCWPRQLKCRSRMHYYLAERHAQRIEPGSRPLLLDEEGRVTETPTANLLIYRQSEGLISPPRETILPGISLDVVEQLAAAEGIGFHERPLEPADVSRADETLLTSTPYCLLPVTRFNRQPIGKGQPGPIYRRLLARWNELAGIDIAVQANRCGENR